MAFPPNPDVRSGIVNGQRGQATSVPVVPPRRRFWLIEFLTMPFKDIDERASYASEKRIAAKKNGAANGAAANGSAINGSAENGSVANGSAMNGLATNGFGLNGHGPRVNGNGVVNGNRPMFNGAAPPMNGNGAFTPSARRPFSR